MTFHTSSFFVGVGTVFAAITIGFAGGAMITSSPKVEPNRLERVAGAGAGNPGGAVKSEAQPVARSSTPTAETTTVAAEPVVATIETPGSQPAVVQEVAPEVTVNVAESKIDNAKKIREAELKKEVELKKSERRAQQRRERRRQQEILASSAVRQMKGVDNVQEVSQREDFSQSLGFFGNN